MAQSVSTLYLCDILDYKNYIKEINILNVDDKKRKGFPGEKINPKKNSSKELNRAKKGASHDIKKEGMGGQWQEKQGVNIEAAPHLVA